MSSEMGMMAATLLNDNDVIQVQCIPHGTGGRHHSRWCKVSDLESQIDELRQRNEDNAAIFLGINPRKCQGNGTKAAKCTNADPCGSCSRCVKLARCIWVDIDNCTAQDGLRRIDEAVLPYPSVLVDSGHGAHAYWRLDEPITDLGLWASYQRGLIKAVDGADPCIVDPRRVMRVPGFINHKPPEAMAVLVRADGKMVWGLEEFPDPIGFHCDNQGLTHCGNLPLAHGVCVRSVSDSALHSDKSAVLRTGWFEELTQDPDFQQAVILSIPDGYGHRARCLFTLTKTLRAHPSLRNVVNPRKLIAIPIYWHNLVKDRVRGSEKECIDAFCHAWRNIKYPGISGPIAEMIERSLTQSIARSKDAVLTSELSRAVWRLILQAASESEDGTWFLAEREIARYLGPHLDRRLSHQSVNRWMSRFRQLGWIKMVQKQESRRAAIHRMVKP